MPPQAPRFIIGGFLPEDVTATCGTGGVAKTTTRLYASVHIALGRRLWDMEIDRPGPVVYITAEDSADKIRWRLWNMADQMGLTTAERDHLDHEIRIVDLTGMNKRLVEFDRGNLVITGLADRVVNEYLRLTPVCVEFDTLQKFCAGLDSAVNEAADQAVNAAMRIKRGLNCAVDLVSHVSKEVQRNGIIDHHAPRGGGALGDGCRAVYQLVTLNRKAAHDLHVGPGLIDDIDQGLLSALHVVKLNDGRKPAHPLLLRRRGWVFERIMVERDPDAIEQERQLERRARTRSNIDKLVAALKERWHQKLSRRQLDGLAGQIGLSRSDLRDAVTVGLLDGYLVELDLPQGERQRQRKTYLAPAGALAAD